MRFLLGSASDEQSPSPSPETIHPRSLLGRPGNSDTPRALVGPRKRRLPLSEILTEVPATSSQPRTPRMTTNSYCLLRQGLSRLVLRIPLGTGCTGFAGSGPGLGYTQLGFVSTRGWLPCRDLSSLCGQVARSLGPRHHGANSPPYPLSPGLRAVSPLPGVARRIPSPPGLRAVSPLPSGERVRVRGCLASPVVFATNATLTQRTRFLSIRHGHRTPQRRRRPSLSRVSARRPVLVCLHVMAGLRAKTYWRRIPSPPGLHAVSPLPSGERVRVRGVSR